MNASGKTPGRPGRRREPLSRDQIMVGAVVILLLLLGAILLLNDPHFRPGKSRVDWPAAPP